MLPCRNDYAVASFLMGLIVTMIGQVAAHHLMSRLQRRRCCCLSCLLHSVYAAYFIVASVSGALYGKRTLNRFWPFLLLCSIIIFCMASLMGVATVVMYLESFLRIRWAERDGALWEWHRICS